MKEITPSPGTHKRGAERSLKSSFHVETTMTFRITAARSLLDPDNEVLPTALGKARRLVVVHDRVARARMPPLHRCLRAWQDAGRLEEYWAVDTDHHDSLGELEVAQLVIDAGVRGHLARHDCFVAVGGERANRIVSLASTSFRRYTPAVHISCDLSSLLATLRSGNRVTLADEPIATTVRDAHVIVDADGIRSSEPRNAAERAALLSLSFQDLEVLERLADWLYPVGDGLVAGAVREDVTVDALAQRWPLEPAAHRPRIPAHGDYQSPSLVRFRTDTAVKQAFKVDFRPELLNPDRGGFEDLLPVGSRVLTVVDAYSQEVLSRVGQCLDHYRGHGRVSRYAIVPMRVSSRGKTFDHVLSVIRKANELGLGEDDRIIAVGGGTIMDIVGYAAFLYGGDTPYARFPTTLVGMIDAGVGIKVGVNMAHKKNLVGAYHPPMTCLCDTSFLRTLPVTELRCGVSEAVKMGVVCDARLFELLERHHDMLLSGKDTPEVKEIIDRAVSAMLYELEPDPFEHNLRRLPDFGHEFGHMLESLSGYQFRHGEAVAIGMALSCQLADYTGRLSTADLERILTRLTDIGLPVWGPVCDADVLWRKLRDDVVPHKGGHLYLVVPTAIGSGDYIDSLDEISPGMLQSACATLEARARKIT